MVTKPFPPRPDMLAPITPEMIQVAVDRLVERFHPFKVILFGSQARGTTWPHSDVDLLVVLEQCPHKIKAMAAMLNELRDAPFAKDIVVTTPEEITTRGHLVTSVLRPALAEGKVLYARD